MQIWYWNPIFRLKNNGWISKACEMKRGIRQGCPISASLHLFVAEILSKKINNNENILGLKTNYMEKEVKNIQHAEDMTITQKNIKSYKHALETVNKFCIYAGSKVNISKTECFLLGPFKNIFHSNLGREEIWNKTDRIKQKKPTFISHVKEDGLGITDIESKIKALKAFWVPRFKKNVFRVALIVIALQLT